MSMTLTNAKTYIARVIGGQNDANILALAADAILATAAKWSTMHAWSWLLKDTYNAPIAVTAAVGDYNLPSDFSSVYSVRLDDTNTTLGFIHQRLYDRNSTDQNAVRGSTHYTLYNSGGFEATTQTQVMRLIPLPDSDDTLLLRYYRTIDGAAATIDIPDEYLYTFLDDCKVWLVLQKNANDPRVDVLGGLVARQIKQAIDSDMNMTEDQDEGMVSQYENYLNYRRGRAVPGTSDHDFIDGLPG